MNLSSSVLEPEKLLIHDGYPPQGIFEAPADHEFSLSDFSVTEPPRGRLIGGGGNHHTW
jgi:hypothetical protein